MYPLIDRRTVPIVIVLPYPNPTLLPQFTPLRRQSMRPLDARNADFDAQYDNETLFYDVFWATAMPHGQPEIVALGPPLHNLAAATQDLRVSNVADGAALPWRYQALDRHMQIRITAPHTVTALRFQSSLGDFTVQVPPRRPSLFDGKRVLMTMSKNNKLQWIVDWVRYHRDVHGVDAVLLYDNSSTAYSVGDLAAALAGIQGVVGGVVPWPFKYGPQGMDAKRFWDADYCQHGVFEHARRQYLTGAHSVINADVDELVLSEDGASVCDAAANSWSGIVRYYGRWTIGCETQSAKARTPGSRHKDFNVVLRPDIQRRYGLIPIDTNRCPAKWTVVPSRCPDTSQWRPHVIDRWPVARLWTNAFSYRHFRELSNGWKYQRGASVAFDPVLHEHDPHLAQAYNKVQWSD
jgi:hypothetical protein